MFVCYWNLRLKAAQIYPELFLCFHTPKMALCNRSQCLYLGQNDRKYRRQYATSFSTSRYLTYCLSALVVAVVLAAEEEAPGKPARREHEELCLLKAGPHAGAFFFRTTRHVLVGKSNQVLWNAEKISPLHIFPITEDKKTSFASSLISTD